MTHRIQKLMADLNLSEAEARMAYNIAHYYEPEQATTPEIIKAVAYVFQVPVEKITTSKDRYRRFAEPRMLLSFLLHHVKEMGVDEIGKLTNRNHSTIIHHLRTIDVLMNDRSFNTKASEVQKIISKTVA